MSEPRKTARLIGVQPWLFNRAHVYRLSEPVTADGVTIDHVIVSAGVWDGPEVMAFACDAEANLLLSEAGHRIDCGSAAGTGDHDAAVLDMGYELLPPADPLRQFPNEGLPKEPETEEEWQAFAEKWNAGLGRIQRELRGSLGGLQDAVRRAAEEAERDARNGEAAEVMT